MDGGLIGHAYTAMEETLQLWPEEEREEIEDTANEILDTYFSERGVNDCQARDTTMASLGASAVYMAGVREGNRQTQDEVAEASGISEMTIRNRYPRINEELPRELRVIR